MKKFTWKFLFLSCVCSALVAFGATDTSAFVISGTVSGDCDEGVTIELSGSAAEATVTIGGGDYSFSELTDGTYTVTVSLEGYSFVPSATPTVILPPDQVVDFTCVEDACIPETECSPEAECGTEPDGCGGDIECGTCFPGESCVDNICEEVPVIDCACDDDWKNHGKYVKCVVRKARDLVKAGIISKAEKRAIVKEAARSDCGKKK